MPVKKEKVQAKSDYEKAPKIAKRSKRAKRDVKEKEIDVDWLGGPNDDEGDDVFFDGGSASEDSDNHQKSEMMEAALKRNAVLKMTARRSETGANDVTVCEEDEGDLVPYENESTQLAQKPCDLASLKVRIEDAVMLLSDWQKAKELGEVDSRDVVLAGLVTNCARYYTYSEELARYFIQMFSPKEAVEFFEANEKQRPVTIRMNSLKTRRAALEQNLAARTVKVDRIGDWTKVGLKIYSSQVPVGATPEYLSGQYMLQSASSFIPVMALAPQPDEVVCDMAAAPGGKTTYIGQLMKNTGTIYANDVSHQRCKALTANVHRMGLTNVIVSTLNGLDLKGKLPMLDRVLLDAPCTGTGIISRDPEVKAKRGVADFAKQARLQKELLLAAIDMVKSKSETGGYVVYSTCSINIEENEAVINYALRNRHVKVVPFDSSVNFGKEGFVKYRARRFHPSLKNCRRYYPHTHNMDGFFVAKLKKLSDKLPAREKREARDKFQKPTEVVLNSEDVTEEMMAEALDFPSEAEDAGEQDMKKKNKKERKRLKRENILLRREAQTGSRRKPSGREVSFSAQTEDRTIDEHVTEDDIAGAAQKRRRTSVAACSMEASIELRVGAEGDTAPALLEEKEAKDASTLPEKKKKRKSQAKTDHTNC